MDTSARQIDVVDLIDKSGIRKFHVNLIFWSFLIMVVDGFDLQAIGYVAPSLIKAWQLSRASFGIAFSAGLVGMMIGATQGGSMGDRWGRKRTVLAGVVCFALFTLVTAGATGLSSLVVLRFLAGIGLGCAVPNAIALNTEYAPKKYRATMVTVMFLGYTIGAALGGAAAALMIPHFGWQSVFVLGGVAPLLVAVLCYVYLPESIRFQILRRGGPGAMRAHLQKWFPEAGITEDSELVVHEEVKAGMSFTHLFKENRAPFTVLLWTCFIANLITLHFIANWLPTVIESTGIPLQRAVIVTSLFQLGGTLGGIVISRLLDRGSLMPLVGFFGAAAVMIASIGAVNNSESMLEVVVFAAGLFVVGTQFGLNALAGSSYPTFIRATGVGWALGIGRIGSILGPMVGGILIALKLPLPQIFLYGAIPMLVGCVASFMLLTLRRKAIQRGEDLTVVAGSH
ncbi:MFS transporter [Undibacterium sp. TJN25]|uniref:MFS transporter n=1 Tax=Undibacterium sp. TJN25 TaxID=3413056 RepID=UPI003BF0189F